RERAHEQVQGSTVDRPVNAHLGSKIAVTVKVARRRVGGRRTRPGKDGRTRRHRLPSCLRTTFIRDKTRVRIVYIAGAERSGTTLLGHVIGSVAGAVHVGEVQALWRLGVAANQPNA